MPQPLEDSQLDEVLISSYELRSRLTPDELLQICAQAKTTLCVKLFLQRYLGQQPWIAGDDSLDYYREQMMAIENHPKFTAEQKRWLMVFTAYLSSGKRGAILDQRKALDQMLFSLTQESRDEVYQNKKLFRFIDAVIKHDPNAAIRPTILEAHALYKLLCPSEEVYDELPPDSKAILTRAFGILNQTQHYKESIIVNLSNNHNATFAQFFKIYLTIQSCQSRAEVIGKIGENKSSELFSQPYVIKRLTKLYNEHKEAERDVETLKKVHAVILNDHLNLIEKYPRLSRIIALINPISLDEEGIQKLDVAFARNETTQKLFGLFSTATYRSKYSNFTTLDTLLNYVARKPETTQTSEELAEEARVLFPDLRFAGAKLDINEELIRALDDLCGNLEDLLSYNEIKEAITPSEQSAIKQIIKTIKDTTQPEEKIKLYGPLVDAILNLQVLASKPVQKILVIAAINNFMLPNARVALIEPLLSTVTKLGLSEKNSQAINAYIEKTVPPLTLNTLLSNVGNKLIEDLNQISRTIRDINTVLQELSFNKSMLSRTRMGLLSEQYLQHIHTGNVQTICVLIKLCGRARSISVGSVFLKLTTYAIGTDEQKNTHIQNALNALITALEPPLPSKAIESAILFIFQCANHETAGIVAGVVDLYRNQLEQNQFEEFEQALHYAQTFSPSMADTLAIIDELKTLKMTASVKEIFSQAKIIPNIILAALKLAKQSVSPDAKTALDILLKAMSVDSNGVSESKLRDVFDRLIVLLQNPQLADDIKALYQKRPYFGFELLQKNITQYNAQELGAECRQYDKNPNLKRVIKNTYTQLSETHQQFNVLRVNSVIDDLYDIKKNTAISEAHANTLKQAFYYVNDIGYQRVPHSGMVNQPIKELNRSDLMAYFAKLRAGLASNVDEKTKTLYRLELLAVLREVMYRTTGTVFPYSTQIINVINDVIYHQGNVSSQIKTGEGKTIISTLKAVMLWAEPGHTVDVCTANLELAAQSRREFQNFYDYLEIPTAVIDKDSPDRTYQFNGINFSDVSNFRLYQSRVKFAPDSEWAEMMRRENKPIIDLVLDENDVPILDEYRTAYNFSVQLSDQSLSDVNPNAALYPIINEFIKTVKFVDPKATRKDDVENCKNYFLERNIPFNVNDAQIDIWLDAAVIASRLKENKDFVVTKTTVTINKKEMLVHEAQIIINDRPQPGAKWTDGVHQFLHARLQQENRKEEPFIIEPELSIVDTASSKTFILEHLKTGGRLLGMTGTLGSDAEIKSYEDYELSLYRVPSHKVNRLVRLPALAAAHEAGLVDRFFGKDFINQLKQQILESKKNRENQPILIIAPDIETVNKYNKLLEEFLKENHFNLQTVTGTQATPEEECVRRAGEPGMVTIATPMFGRGTDIKPVRKRGSSDPHPYGLFTICTFLPDLRTEEQIYGRPARNGQLGQYLRLYDPSNNHLVNLEGMGVKERESAIAQARLSRENQAQLKRLYAQATSECMQEYLEKFDLELLSIDVLDTKKLHALQTRRYLFITQIQTQSEALIDQIYEKGIDPFNPYFDQDNRPITTHLDLAQQQLHDFAKELYQDLLDQSLSIAQGANTSYASVSPKKVSRLQDCVHDIMSANALIGNNEQNEMYAFIDSFVSYYDQYRSVQIEKYKNDLNAAEHIEEICKLADDVNRISYEFSYLDWDSKKIGVEVATVIELLLLKTDKRYYSDMSTQFFQGFVEALNRLSHVTQNKCVQYCWRTLLLKDSVRAKWLPYLSDSVKQDFYALCSETVRKNYQADLLAYIDANRNDLEKSKNIHIAEHYQMLLSSYPIHEIDFSDEKMPGYQAPSSSGIFYSSSGTTSLTDPTLRELIESVRTFKRDISTNATAQLPSHVSMGIGKKY